MDIHQILSNAQSLLEEAQGSAASQYSRAAEQALDRLGLQHKRDTADVLLPAVGIFAAGVVLGATLGLLFAPNRGEETRTRIVTRFEDLRERIPGRDEGEAPEEG